MLDVIDLRQEPCLYEDLWHPRVVAELNDIQFKSSSSKETLSGTSMTTPMRRSSSSVGR